ncbi:MAG: DUF2442 domain-containing protein [Rhodocyclaceae bacterium]|nr:DUF2442 domain-containing protein [Rhodocyclaceae bacterium]
MNWDVVKIELTTSRTLMVQFADGLCGTIGIPPSFCTGVFQPLLDNTLLAQATLKNGVVVWPNGLDLAPDTMHREIQRNPARHYNVGVIAHS